ncbi:glycosyl hydrolase superfamily protein [Actinidia rufa]|uniref:mannan endo-1,4-beta-mannosidase n=1 Tax=Actinidia rufa TaxID=165716 RepID=A0A7J0GHW6_9ERIC|nr:glycosyl hydrolase superfamily protein [Actinidia rufa]
MKHWALLILALLLTHQQVEAGDGFIRTRGVHFLLNGSPYYANGFNAYWLMYMATDPSQRSKISSAFHEATSHGLTVARTWAFSDGGYRALQSSPGSYNEQTFQGLDFVVSEAGRYGIKLNLEEGRFNSPRSVVTRRNSITGVEYKDDPTIMAWELMNEPRCPSDPSGRTIQGWITEMASYLKSIDGNHLLEAGLEGFYGESAPQKQEFNLNFQVGTDFIANNQIPGIDFATAHSYPDVWLAGTSEESQLSFLSSWVNNHIQDAQNILQKPLLFAEFGKSLKDSGFNMNQRDKLFDTVYSAIYSSARGGGAAAGGLFWQLLTEGMDSFRDGYEIVLSESSSTASLIAQHSQKINKIRKMYARLRNIEIWKRAREKINRKDTGN